GSRKWIERPKSPRTALARNTRYCAGSGRSRPSSRRTRKISLRGASGGKRRGTGSPERRMTPNTTVETSQTAIRARRSRGARKRRTPRIGATARGPDPRGPGPRGALGATESQVEAPDLELLVRVRRPLDVLLETVVLVGLDHGNPRQVLEEDLRHLAVGLGAKLLVHREPRGLTELVEARVTPVVLRPAGRQEPPHHAVGVAERRGRVRPPQALERLVAVLLGADRVLEHLDLRVVAVVAPHALDRLGHRLVVGRIADGRLDDDLLAPVAPLPEPLARLAGVVREGRQLRVEVVVAPRDRPARDDTAPSPELLHDRLAVHGERQRLLDERVVERRTLAVHGQDVEARVQRARDLRRSVAPDALLLVGRELRDDIHLALKERGDAGRRLRDRPDDDPVHFVPAAPIVRVRLEHELVVLRPRDEAHRARADGLGVELLAAHLLHVLLRDDLAAVEGEARGEQRVGLLGVDDERGRVGRLDAVDRG